MTFNWTIKPMAQTVPRSCAIMLENNIEMKTSCNSGPRIPAFSSLNRLILVAGNVIINVLFKVISWIILCSAQSRTATEYGVTEAFRNGIKIVIDKSTLLFNTYT